MFAPGDIVMFGFYDLCHLVMDIWSQDQRNFG